jgi:hypothetical protein
MRSGTPNNKQSEVLLKVLTAHYHALVSARSDETLLKEYSALLRFLKLRKTRSLEDSAHAEHRTDTSRPLPTLTAEELRKASLDDIDKLVCDDVTSRKDLEYIAIQRFSVPRGSMRSFSNRRMLVDKLRALIDNERTHETIGAVARGQSKQRSDS